MDPKMHDLDCEIPIGDMSLSQATTSECASPKDVSSDSDSEKKDLNPGAKEFLPVMPNMPPQMMPPFQMHPPMPGMWYVPPGFPGFPQGGFAPMFNGSPNGKHVMSPEGMEGPPPFMFPMPWGMPFPPQHMGQMIPPQSPPPAEGEAPPPLSPQQQQQQQQQAMMQAHMAAHHFAQMQHAQQQAAMRSRSPPQHSPRAVVVPHQHASGLSSPSGEEDSESYQDDELDYQQQEQAQTTHQHDGNRHQYNHLQQHDGSMGMSKHSHHQHTAEEFSLDMPTVLSGKDERTTLMVKNIPNKYTQKNLLELIDRNHEGTYDFFYLPIDFKNKCNLGYAFINFTEPKHIVPFFTEFANKRWGRFNSDKVCELSYARIQSKQSLVSHFRNSRLMFKHEKYRPIVIQAVESKPGGPNTLTAMPLLPAKNAKFPPTYPQRKDILPNKLGEYGPNVPIYVH